MIWSQTLRGRAFDLINPDARHVDFAEIADTLAFLRRYAGAAEKPVSVAQHTLIVFDAAQPEDRAHVLLHDAHEAYIGDIITPTAQALAAIVEDLLQPRRTINGRALFLTALASLKTRIDGAIYHAAGLAPPGEDQRARIRRADLIALRTERRDFLAKPPKPWEPEIEALAPLSKKYRLRAAPDVADELLQKFNTYLPALRSNRAA
jgi:hypothetical protein